MKSLLLAAALSLAMCDAPPPAPPPNPGPLPGEFTCAIACDQFRFLGCSEAAATPAGATCVEVCDNAQASPAPLDLGCIVRSQSCAQARECE